MKAKLLLILFSLLLPLSAYSKVFTITFPTSRVIGFNLLEPDGDPYGDCFYKKYLTQYGVDILNTFQSRYNYKDYNGWCALSSLNLSNLNIDKAPEALKGLDQLTNVNIYNNSISKIDWLSGYDSLNYLDIRKNPISDLSSLSKKTAGTYYLDQKNYDKLDPASNFCQAFNKTDTVYGALYYNVCKTSADQYWVYYLKSKCGKTYSTLADVRQDTGSLVCNSRNLTFMPDYPIGDVSYASINFSYNQLPSIKGLGGIVNLTDLYLNNNNITDISPLSSLSTISYLNLSNNNISSTSSLKSGLSISSYLNLDNNSINDISKIGSFNFSDGVNVYLAHNKIDSTLPLLSLKNIANLDLSYNDITNLSGLTNLTNSTGTVNLSNNPSLDDVSGLQNLQSTGNGFVYFDSKDFTKKMPASSAFCTGFNNGKVRTEYQRYYNFCQDSNNGLSWLDFINKNANMNFANLLDVGSYTSTINSSGKSITVLPKAGITKIAAPASGYGYYYLQSNALSNVDGFADLTDVGCLYLNNNQISNISGLSNLKNAACLYLQSNQISDVSPLLSLTTVASGNINLSNNKIINLNGIQNITNSNIYLNVENNPALQDVSSLSQLPNYSSGYFYADDKNYTNKASASSSFCTNLKSHRISYSGGYNYYGVCDDLTDGNYAYDWLHFIKTNAGGNSYFLTMADLANASSTINSSGKGITSLPNATVKQIALNGSGSYNLSNNSLTNLNGFSDLTDIGGLNLSNNKLTDISGLSNLSDVKRDLILSNNQISNIAPLSKIQSAYNFYLNNNLISDLTGLNNLQTVYNLDLEYNSFSNVNPLSALRGFTYLKLDKNSNLTDLSGLSNYAANGSLYLDDREYNKIANTASICSRIKSHYVSLYGANYYEMCDDTTDGINPEAWLRFFNHSGKYGFVSLKDVASYNASINLSNLGISSLPSHGVENIASLNTSSNAAGLDLSGNSLTSLSGFSDLKTVGDFNLSNNQITTLAGLDNLNTVNYSFNITQNSIGNLNNLNSLITVKRDFYANGIGLTDISGLSNLQQTYYLHLNNNNITSVKTAFSSLTSVQYIDLSNNNLQDISGLSNLPSMYYLNLSGNSNITDVSPLANVQVTKTDLYAKDYTIKPAASTLFCTNIKGHHTTLNGADYYQVCNDTSNGQNAQAWLTFINTNSGTNFVSLADLTTYTGSLNMATKSISTMPSPGISLLKFEANTQGSWLLNGNSLTDLSAFSNLQEIGGFNLSSNKISDITGLSNLTTVDGYLDLSNNNITSLSSLSSLTHVGNYLDVSNNNAISSLNGLQNLQTIGTLRAKNINIANLNELSSITSFGTMDLSGDANLVDVSGIKSVAGGGRLYLPANSNYNKLLYTTALCSAIKSHSRNLTGPNYYDICNDTTDGYNGSAWLAFVNTKTNNNFVTLKDVENFGSGTTYSNNAHDYILNFSGLGISSLPAAGPTSFYNGRHTIDIQNCGWYSCSNHYSYQDVVVDFSNNSLTNIDGLSAVQKVNTLKLNNNQLGNANGLASLTSAKYLYLNNNAITDITGLSSLTSVSYLYLNNNNLVNLNGLSGLTSVGTIDLRGNSSLVDISGLQNLAHGTLYLDTNNTYNKLQYTTPLCSAIKSGAVNLSGPSYYDICVDNTDGNNAAAWVDFINTNSSNHFVTLKGIEDFGKSLSVYNQAFLNMNGKGITALPAAGPTYFYNGTHQYYSCPYYCYYQTEQATINLSSNALTNVDGLSAVQSFNTLDLNNNQLTNVNGLSSLNNANVLNLNNNNLINLDGLSKLTSINTLYVETNQLTNVNGLSSLTSASQLYLNNNQLNDIRGLSGLTSVNYLNLNTNQLTNLNGLSGLTHVGNLYLTGNPNLVDISGISNLSTGRVTFDSSIAVTNKLSSTSAFCTGVTNNTLTIVNVNYGNVCN